MFTTDVNREVVNTQSCRYNPQTQESTCNVKALLEAVPGYRNNQVSDAENSAILQAAPPG